ncbi:hypothetical protein BGZ93_001341 [Podila epicladia]|nr:hypothetical protein BGZ93_001341 [Podila epicladia]
MCCRYRVVVVAEAVEARVVTGLPTDLARGMYAEANEEVGILMDDALTTCDLVANILELVRDYK